MDERVSRLRTARDAEALARNAARNGRPDIAEQASVRALELKAAEKAARRGALPAKESKSAEKRALAGRKERPALFMNGVFEEVLNEILDAQAAHGGLMCYLQPYKPALIKRLHEDPPSPERPWRLFMSLTHSLGLVSFEAEIVEWSDKSALDSHQIQAIDKHIAAHQPSERGLHFEEKGGEYGRNLLGIVDLQRIEPALSVAGFIKVSDDLPLRDRTRAGGWSYVTPPQSRTSFEIVAEMGVRAAESKELEKALGRSAQERKQRLAEADPVPQQIFVLTKAFRRNQDVVAEVLARAHGSCEDCREPAPFLRAKDGTPFLEVHHLVTLAQGGLDTVENAIALCPNCHRKRHHGQPVQPVTYG